MKNPNFLLSLIVISLLTPACGSKKKSKEQPTQQITMFVHGDPNALIRGAMLNRISFLNDENFSNFDGYHVSRAMTWLEKTAQRDTPEWSQIEKENSTSLDQEEEDPFQFVTYHFEKVGTRLVLKSKQNPEDQLSLVFTKINERWELASIGADHVQIEHYSLRADGKAFSFLFSFTDSRYGKGLMAIVFADSAVVKPLTSASTDFNYLVGHYPLRWEEPIKIDLCGSPTALQQQTVQASVEAWLADPEARSQDVQRSLQYSLKTVYAPFSDLNQHCIYLVSNFRAEDMQGAYVAGLNAPAINGASKEIIDSDIFMFMDHVGDDFGGGANSTLMHEMGHFLGLGHEFKEQDHEHYLSIMGYSDQSNFISPKDFQAIRALYGSSLVKAQP